MFDVILMTNTSPKNYLDKNLTTVSTVSGVLRDESNIVNPSILVEMNSVPAVVNYLYVGEFGRYYFVNDIVSVRNGLWRFDCTSDPLTSFKSQIRACTGIIKRAESADAFNVMLDDGSFKAYNNPVVITKEFPSGFTTKNYVLAVAG